MSAKRKWTPTKYEVQFEELLKKGGFDIVDIKEYASVTKYKIAKDGLEYNGWFEFYNEVRPNAQRRYDFFVKAFEEYKELLALRAEMAERKLQTPFTVYEVQEVEKEKVYHGINFR